jgi:hypothetical protein
VLLWAGVAGLVAVDMAEVPKVIGIDQVAAAGAVDESLSDFAGPAPAQCLVLRPVSPLLGSFAGLDLLASDLVVSLDNSPSTPVLRQSRLNNEGDIQQGRLQLAIDPVCVGN